MQTVYMDPFYSSTFAQARERFEQAVVRNQGRMVRYPYPGAYGPDGGDLSIDAGVFGPPDASRALLVIAGTHGGEGYAGSAAQLTLLASGRLEQLPPDVRVVLVHGLNPYGFAHGSRTTETNVDLNRNFIDFSRPRPGNSGYEQLHRWLCPDQWTAQSRELAQGEMQRWRDAHGNQAWLESIMKGQWDVPDGLNFGGHTRERSNIVLQAIIDEHLARCRKLAFIDWHTGLGGYGEPFFLSFNPPGEAAWLRCCRWWGTERVENKAAFGDAQRPRYEGLVFHGVQRFAAHAEMAGAVIEFGTFPIERGLDQLRIDRWLRFCDGQPDGIDLDALRRGVLEGFYPSDPAWRQAVIKEAREIQLRALDGLTDW